MAEGETRKRAAIRKEEGWFEKYLVGSGIDIGCGKDPVTEDCRHWDIEDGDAQFMEGVPDASFDWVYSSHCLEHVHDPSVALANWWRILKPGGHLVVMVPDEDLYEQGMWPPHFNVDHKTTWTISKSESWSPVCRNLAHEFGKLPKAKILSLRLYDTGYDYDLHQMIAAQILVSHAHALEIQNNGFVMSPTSAPLKCAGFLPVDQSSGLYGAEMSIEGIIKKL